jgi:uncharacterized lipoprotein YajG
MLKFKEGVKGFVFDSSNDEITKVFNKVLSADEAILITEVIDDDSILFLEEEFINEVFTVKSEENLLNSELNRVLDWIN